MTRCAGGGGVASVAVAAARAAATVMVLPRADALQELGYQGQRAGPHGGNIPRDA